MDLNSFLRGLLEQGPLVVILYFILYGGYKKMWVWGYQYDEMKQDRDEWIDFAKNGTNLADKAVDKIDKIRRVR